MKKQSVIKKRGAVWLLSVMLILMLIPGNVQAQESDFTNSGAEKGAQDIETVPDTYTENGIDGNEAGDTVPAADESDASDGLTGEDPETETSDGQSQSDDSMDGNEDLSGDEQIDDQEDDNQQVDLPGITADPIAVAIPMDSTNDLYGSLSQFLALSSDQFQIYTVAIVDPVTQQPVQPESALKVSLSVPSGYDTDRLVISELSMDGKTPVRTEVPFSYNNGQAAFETDHSGIYVVMEKKEQVELPSSLEPTEKVDKLELTKKYPDSVSSGSSTVRATVNPQTGDDNSVVVWGVITAAAAAAVIALIIIINRRK